MEIPIIPSVKTNSENTVKVVTNITTKKRKTVILPELQTYIVQPNRITNAIFEGFTLIQHKAVTAIMLKLQEAIKINMNNGDYKQLSLFQHFDQSLKFDLSLKDITSDPTAYTDVKQAIFKMSEINVKIPLKDEKGKLYHYSSSLITALIPDVADYKSVISIKIESTIAEYLIQIDKGPHGLAQNYTRYMYQVAQMASSIYTIQIYKIISSWKKKGGFTIAYNDFREMLSIAPTKYTRFSDFKKYVIIPAQNDLFEKGDCWFNSDIAGFKLMRRNKEGDKELFLNFKIITPEFKQTMLKQRSNVVNLLSTHFGFKDIDLKSIAHLLDDENIPSDLITMKIIKISESIENSYKDINKAVKNKTAYALKALLANDWLKI